MKTPVLWLLASFLLLNAHAQNPAPKPGPEHKKLEIWTGEWTYEGTYTNPQAKGGKFTGVQSGRMILNGFFVELRYNDKGDFGDQKGVLDEGLMILGYDSKKNVYIGNFFGHDGRTTLDSLTVEGNTWKWTYSGTDADGKNYQNRAVCVFSDDGNRITINGESQSGDGKLIPGIQLTMNKVGGPR